MIPIYIRITFALFMMSVLPVGLFAQGFYMFGRQKIQYMNFDWHVMETEHFQIYFYPEMEILAERGAQFAEEAYDELSMKFNGQIERKIPLIFYSSHLHFQQTNVTPGYIPEGVGGFFEFLKGRVVVPSDGSITRFRRVVRHELIHVFTHYKVNRVVKDRGKFFNGDFPLWFTEGIAEYWSGPWDGQSEMVIRDAVLSGYLVPMVDILRIQGSYLMYKEGENFLRYIGEKYGNEKLLLLMENVWRDKSFHENFKMIYQKTFRDLDDEWMYYLKKKYYPKMEHEDIPSMAADKITLEGYNSKPAFYRNGDRKYIVFISNRTGYTNIYLQEIDGEKDTQDPEILVEGERTPEYESFHVFRSKIDVSADGMLAFVSKTGGSDAIYVYDIPKRKELNQFSFKDIVSLSSPSWSPDGKAITVSGIDIAGDRDLYLICPRDGSIRRLTDDYYDDRDPAWHPNGRYIAFSSDRSLYDANGAYNIFALDLAASRIVRLTGGNHVDSSPVWSPDGKCLAFTSDRGGATNIWAAQNTLPAEVPANLLASMTQDIGNQLVNPVRNDEGGDYEDFSGPTSQVTRVATGIFDPEWTDDGDLYFSSFEKFNFSIQKMHYTAEDSAAGSVPDSAVIPRPTLARAWSPERIPQTQKIITRPYEKKYNLDVLLGQIAQHPYFGTSGGSILSFSDMLGNDYYTLLLFNNAQRRSDFADSFNIALTRYTQGKRTNFVYGVYNLDYRWYNNIDGYFDKSEYGGYVGLQYPFSSFTSIQATLNFSHLLNEYYEVLKNTRQALLLSGFISYTKDNSLWVHTGPIDGERFMVTLGQTTDLQFDNISYYTIAVDYRRYFRLSMRSAYAIRLMTLYRHGKDPEKMFMGGSWDLRGYRRFGLWGQKLGLISQELRFPLLDHFSIGFPKGGLRLSGIRGALFLDAGNAWNHELNGVLGSVGGGLRMNIGFIVLRFDVGRKIEDNFSKLSDKVFTQFFFGWDF